MIQKKAGMIRLKKPPFSYQKNYEIKVIRKPKLINIDSKNVKVISLEDKLFLIPIV